MRSHQVMDDGVYEVDVSPVGCVDGARKFLMVGTIGVGFVAFFIMMILKMLEKVQSAKASAAWARAAQLDAQANLVDARTAQLGTLFTGLLPLIIVLAIFFLVIAAVVLRQATRPKPEEIRTYILGPGQQLELHRPPTQWIPGSLHAPTELYVPHEREQGR